MWTEGDTFQPLPKLARRALARAFRGHAGLALFAGEVLRADRPRLGLGDAVEVAEVEIEAVKRRLRRKCIRGEIPDGQGGPRQEDDQAFS